MSTAETSEIPFCACMIVAELSWVKQHRNLFHGSTLQERLIYVCLIGPLYMHLGLSLGGKRPEEVECDAPEIQRPNLKGSNSTYDGSARHNLESLSTSYLCLHATATKFFHNLDQNYGHLRLSPFSQLPLRFGLTMEELRLEKCSDRRMDL